MVVIVDQVNLFNSISRIAPVADTCNEAGMISDISYRAFPFNAQLFFFI
jgi:hypothetical protein